MTERKRRKRAIYFRRGDVAVKDNALREAIRGGGRVGGGVRAARERSNLREFDKQSRGFGLITVY